MRRRWAARFCSRWPAVFVCVCERFVFGLLSAPPVGVMMRSVYVAPHRLRAVASSGAATVPLADVTHGLILRSACIGAAVSVGRLPAQRGSRRLRPVWVVPRCAGGVGIRRVFRRPPVAASAAVGGAACGGVAHRRRVRRGICRRCVSVDCGVPVGSRLGIRRVFRGVCQVWYLRVVSSRWWLRRCGSRGVGCSVIAVLRSRRRRRHGLRCSRWVRCLRR